MAWDALDLEVLLALQLDSEMTIKDMGERLRVSNGTIHNRIKRLTEGGVLKEKRIVVDWGLLGYKLAAFVGVSLCEALQLEHAHKKLRQIPEVLESHYTTGEFSLILKIVAKDSQDLFHILTHKLQRIPEIQSTNTFVILNTLMDRELDLGAMDLQKMAQTLESGGR